MKFSSYPDSAPKPEDWKDLDVPVKLERFESLVDSAAKKGIFSNLPTSLQESGAASVQGVRILGIDYSVRAEVIGERLWLLGYLDGDKAASRDAFAKEKDVFLQAVRLFQKEAGLVEDGWAGPKTWTMLSNLVNFERQSSPVSAGANSTLNSTDTDSADGSRVRPSGANSAVMRAAALRLHVLGFAGKTPLKSKLMPDGKWVEAFHRMLWALQLTTTLSGNELNAETLALLLDHEALVQAVVDRSDTDHDGAFAIRRQDGWAEELFEDEVQRFLTRLAQIELWLLGLDVDLSDMRTRYPVAGFRPRPMPDPQIPTSLNSEAGDYFDPDNKLQEQLTLFCTQFLGLEKYAAKSKAEELRPSLFKAWSEDGSASYAVGVDHAAHSNAPVHDDSDATFQQVMAGIREKATSGDADGLLNEGRSLGMRLWDGLKRLWRWVKRKTVQVLETGKNLIKNLARLFFSYATRGFSIVRRALRAVAEGLGYALGGGMEHSGVRFSHSADFDTLVFVPTGLTSANVAKAGLRLRLTTASFQLACRIVGLVLDALMNSITGLAGWVRMAYALASQLKPLRSIDRELVALESELKATP